jgi:hypothetical protein
MKIAILVGFEYSVEENLFLPGILVDLYRSYSYCLDKNFDQIFVITDISSDGNSKLLSELIIGEGVPTDIFSFIQNLSKTDSYVKYSTKEDFLSKLHEICSRATQLLFYFSGHVDSKDSGNFLFPNFTKFSISSFSSFLLLSCSPFCEIFSILDCCHGNGFFLPFRLIPEKKGRYIFEKPVSFSHFVDRQIICLSATQSKEKSKVDFKGSYFSKVLFSILSDEILLSNLIRSIHLVTKKEYFQTATVYSSFPNILSIWNWVNSKSRIGIFLRIEPNVISLFFPPKNEKETSNYPICFKTE